jgi:DNA processing protein
LSTYDYPPFLYVRGTLAADDSLSVAIVGSRLASVYGRFTSEKLSRELAMQGVTIVSGLARGIDAAAHRGALAAKGRTIAVLGAGIDIIYPPQNEELADRIINNNGAVVTEFSIGTPPNAPNFPSRNRIISGISYGVVVVEAGEKSGSLITARIAAEQGRSVFAVPGEIASAGSRGVNHLIKQGATLIENIDDILDEILPQAGFARVVEKAAAPTAKEKKTPLPFEEVNQKENEKHEEAKEEKRKENQCDKEAMCPPVPAGVKTTDEEATLLGCIAARQVDIDTLIRETGLSARSVQNVLLRLELKGLVAQLPGRQYSLRQP